MKPQFLRTGASQVVSSVEEPACPNRRQETQTLGWEDLLEEGMAPTPVFLSRESHGQRSLAVYSPWGSKELDKTEATECTGNPYNKKRYQSFLCM